MEQIIQFVVSAMKQQMPPQEIVKALGEKFQIPPPEAAKIMQSVAQKLQGEAQADPRQQEQGDSREQQPAEDEQSQEEKPVKAEQALKVLEDNNINEKHALIMLALFSQMSMNEVAKLGAAIQRAMQEEEQGQGQQQERQQRPQMGAEQL